MKNKAVITIMKNLKDSEGNFYTSVGYDGKRYGGGFPCKSDEEINEALEYCKKEIEENEDRWIIEEGQVVWEKSQGEGA